MTRYLISFPSGAMDHIPAEEFPAVGEAAHAVVREAMDAGVWVFAAGWPRTSIRSWWPVTARSPWALTRRPRSSTEGSRSSTCRLGRQRWSGPRRSRPPAAVLRRSASSCLTRRSATERGLQAWVRWSRFAVRRALVATLAGRQAERERDRLNVDELPVGTVTFLFTDIEGSTRLLKLCATATAKHSRIIRGSCARPSPNTAATRSTRRETRSSLPSGGPRTRCRLRSRASADSRNMPGRTTPSFVSAWVSTPASPPSVVSVMSASVCTARLVSVPRGTAVRYSSRRRPGSYYGTIRSQTSRCATWASTA